MNIIICDDEQKDAEHAKRVLLTCEAVNEADITIVTPQELRLMLEVGDIACDIAIMDIEYTGQNFDGIALSREINQKLPVCQIIYLTWVLEFAPEVYDTVHCYFVLKENMEKMLPRAMEKAFQVYRDQEEHDIYELREHGKTVYLRQSDIEYIERQERRVILHTKNQEYCCYQSLAKIAKQLGRNFLRCHGGYIINYNYIQVCKRETVEMTSGVELPIGRTYRSQFHEQYMRLIEQHV